ncbi:hypothetical protein PGT21_050225 [Puccinia graminis f. sp. tritici]|uniref:RING-type domain-containing protein n=1 Tax=Puccinia graminis f. sp. tritici TaxID=56615 RepID=A0A5B0RXC4_PUCGR|nr:hypothetical protein PGT21_050225 [Puccinia graminis f. sp. tritici]KAA1130072.1 hypothetical protein PGTUg99_006620 [Puccinia graminis f. sp. tritici]
MKLLSFTSKSLSIALVILLFIKVSQEAAFPHGSSSGVENVPESEGKAIEVTDNPRVSSSETTCPICLDDLHNNKEKGQIGALEQCGHSFHCACADRWLQTKGTCPLCRSEYGHSEFKYKEDPTIYHVNSQEIPSFVSTNTNTVHSSMNDFAQMLTSRLLQQLN